MCIPNILPNSSVVYSSVPVHGGHSVGLQVSSYWIVCTVFSFFRSDKPFTPTSCSDPLMLGNLLRQWQELLFLTSGILSHLSRQSLRFLRTPLPRAWARITKIPRFPVLGPIQTASSTSTFRTQSGSFGPPTLGFSFTGSPCYDCYRQHQSSV